MDEHKEQEPAFYIVEMELEALRRDGRRAMVLYTEPITNGIEVPVYTTPPQRTAAEGEDKKTWVGLTDEEIQKMRHLIDWTAGWSYNTFARAVEAKLKEKNA